jgi:trehalose-6-phosphate synthase
MLPTASVGFFLHVPFPSSELFRCFPRKNYVKMSVFGIIKYNLLYLERSEILNGILGANLIGFQVGLSFFEKKKRMY